MFIDRSQERERVSDALRRSRVVILAGARQVGKTTLARSFVSPGDRNYFDLEDPADLARLEAPSLALASLEGIVVIDEVQRRPELLPILRVLADRTPLPAKFLLLGSAAPELLRGVSESLAGRVEILEMGGFSLDEVGPASLDRLWVRGGFPESFLADDDRDSLRWRQQYLRSLTARDLPELGVGLSPATVERFLGLIAHVHGQLWNAAAPARATGISETTARKYLDILSDALMVRVLQPWTTNPGKRIVRSPKVYFRDSGLVHALLGAQTLTEVERLPSLGASWEGFALEQILRQVDDTVRPYFWRTSNGAEIDLVLPLRSGLVGIEIKRTDAPRLTPSMRSARADLALERLLVVHSGERSYPMAEGVEAIPIAEIATLSLA